METKRLEFVFTAKEDRLMEIDGEILDILIFIEHDIDR